MTCDEAFCWKQFSVDVLGIVDTKSFEIVCLLSGFLNIMKENKNTLTSRNYRQVSMDEHFWLILWNHDSPVAVCYLIQQYDCLLCVFLYLRSSLQSFSNFIAPQLNTFDILKFYLKLRYLRCMMLKVFRLNCRIVSHLLFKNVFEKPRNIINVSLPIVWI